MDKYEAQRLGTNADAQGVLAQEVAAFFPQLEAEREISAEVIGQFYDWEFPFTYTQDGGGARRWRASVRAVCRRNRKLQQLEELFESSGTDGTLKEVYSGQDEDEYTDNRATRTKTEFAGVGTTTSENLGDTQTTEPVDGKNNTVTVRKKGTTRTYADGRTWTQILKDVGAAVDPVDEFVNAFAQVLLPPCECPRFPLPPSVSMAVEVEELPAGTPPTAEIVNKGSSLAADWLLSLGLPLGPQGDAATIEIGTVTTGEAGTPAEVENVGTENAAVLNFTIPQGEKGDAGEDAFRAYVNTKGATLLSFNDDFSPSALFGGSWEKITDRFLVGAGGSYTLSSTGGEANVTLTVEQIPSHYHALGNSNSNFNPSYGFGFLASVDGGEKRAIYNPTANTGGGQAHNNMPPYIAVNIWHKVA